MATAAAAAVRDEIAATGGRAVVSTHDVSDPGQAKDIIDTAISEFGGIHLVVSNAGIISSHTFDELTVTEFERVMRVNAFGSFNVVHAAWPHLMAQKFGRVVVVTSSTVWVPQVGIAHYAASKGAVLGMGTTIAHEGAAHGITVNMLAPGAFTAMAGELPPEARRLSELIQSPALVSPVVCWLLRKENTLNGKIIEASSGRAAINFVGSGRGYWKKDLTIDDLVAHADEVLLEAGYAIIEDTTRLVSWMTTETTRWANEPEVGGSALPGH